MKKMKSKCNRIANPIQGHSTESDATAAPPQQGGVQSHQQPQPPLQQQQQQQQSNRDGALSPTSNQLARWFSPELLAQASAGKLPSLNIGQALSLEEFERNIQHSSATVHN